MPTAHIKGVDLHYEESGSGFPLIFCHEFAGDMRSWSPQVRHFSRRYRVITFNYRGYPPSSVPAEESAYSHEQLVDDLRGLMDFLEIAQAHIAGLATGGNLALNFAIAHPNKVCALVVAGAGAGTSDRENWLAGAERFADDIARDGTAGIVGNIANAPQRVIFREKDPRGWDEFIDMMGDFSPMGCIHLLRNALSHRKPVTALRDEIAALPLPILVMVGDQDHPASESSRFIRDHARFAGLCVLPMCGHTLNSEEPLLFNLLVADYLAAVEAGRWGRWRKNEY